MSESGRGWADPRVRGKKGPRSHLDLREDSERGGEDGLARQRSLRGEGDGRAVRGGVEERVRGEGSQLEGIRHLEERERDGDGEMGRVRLAEGCAKERR